MKFPAERFGIPRRDGWLATVPGAAADQAPTGDK